jgi:hypothetical protein
LTTGLLVTISHFAVALFHPIATLREGAGSGRDNHRTGQQQ